MQKIRNQIVHPLPITIYVYNTFWKRFRGLMFKKKPIVNEGIWIIPCNSIHMFFMFFPIDVVFLNSNNEVIYLKESVKPWSLIFPINNAASVMELPVNTIRSYDIKIGDSLKQ
ncbi:DUF192 domain-containing protein [Neobacillus muris]|uniref:DUF192 domain-containing protein n=1 Tax=Neobacillus muris TaxID=2941334 RepID=UPI00204049E8|nr:DUF192 domain-containing protein [Neobacillus muris]